jgi:stringent starvation protein B
MAQRSRRPYLIRAIYDWAVDNGYTPYLLVAADQAGVMVPKAYVKDNKIALDLSPAAIRNLNLNSEPIFFSARFGGTGFDIEVPSGAVLAIYARENGEGILFGEPEPTPPTEPPKAPDETSARPGRAKLRVVK